MNEQLERNNKRVGYIKIYIQIYTIMIRELHTVIKHKARNKVLFSITIARINCTFSKRLPNYPLVS